MTGEHGAITHALIHAQEALALDHRVSELGLRLAHEPVSDVVCIRGVVADAEQQAAVIAVVRDELRRHGVVQIIRDETDVMVFEAPGHQARPL